MQKAIKIIVTIVTLLLLIVGSANVLGFATKTLKISKELAIIHDNIQLYNESSVRSPRWDQETRELIEYREANFYQSEDWWTRNFSNMNGVLKAFIAIAMVCVYPILAFSYFCLLAMFLAVWKKKRRRTR